MVREADTAVGRADGVDISGSPLPTRTTDPGDAATIVVDAGSQLGASHQLWQADEVDKLGWSFPQDIGVIDGAARDPTGPVDRTAKNLRATVIATDPPESAVAPEWVQPTLGELIEEGIDVTGEGFAPIDITLVGGGNLQHPIVWAKALSDRCPTRRFLPEERP